MRKRYAATYDDGFGSYRIWYSDTYITLFFSDGTTKERITDAHDCYKRRLPSVTAAE